MKCFVAVVDSGIRVVESEAVAALGKAGVKDLLGRFEHKNPEHGKKRAMGLSTYGVPATVKSWRREEGEPTTLRFPRGGTERIREAAARVGAKVVFRDLRLKLPEVEFPPHRFPGQGEVLRWYQLEAIAEASKREQGIIRAPTGSGKTSTGLALTSALRQPTLVIVRKRGLLDQWLRRIEVELGIPAREVGIIGAGKKRVGRRITLGLQQTLWSAKFPLEEFGQRFGLVVVDECQEVGSRTFERVVDALPARYRIGLSADERRRDSKEFVVYDQLGDVIHQSYREDLEAEGSVVPVVVRLVPTDDVDGTWYAASEPSDRDFGKLLEELASSETRDRVVVAAVRDALRLGQRPVLVFTRRREHAIRLADVAFFAAGVRSGLLLGSPESKVRFDEDLARLASGDLDACAGTIEAVGVGTDVPLLRAGVVALPLGDNPQLFNQIRGRICRPAAGKTVGYLYYLWDQLAFPGAPRNLYKWAQGRLEVPSGGSWVAADRDGQPKRVRARGGLDE